MVTVVPPGILFNKSIKETARQTACANWAAAPALSGSTAGWDTIGRARCIFPGLTHLPLLSITSIQEKAGANEAGINSLKKAEYVHISTVNPEPHHSHMQGYQFC